MQRRLLATLQLQRGLLSSTSSLAAIAAAAAATATRTTRCHYALHASCVRRQRDNNNSNSNRNSDAAAAAEDREELERERALRAQFAQKIQQQHGDASTSAQGAAASSSSPYMPPTTSSTEHNYHHQQQQQMRFAPGAMQPSMAMQRLLRMLFFLCAFMLLLGMLPLLSPRSPVYVMQGLPWWQLPIATTAYYMLLRVIYPRSEEERLRLEYAAASRSNPYLTFDQFINQQHPTMFQGYRSSQAEAVAAVAACLSAARDMRFVQTMRRAAGRAADPKKAVDDIVDALRHDYPQLF